MSTPCTKSHLRLFIPWCAGGSRHVRIVGAENVEPGLVPIHGHCGQHALIASSGVPSFLSSQCGLRKARMICTDLPAPRVGAR